MDEALERQGLEKNAKEIKKKNGQKESIIMKSEFMREMVNILMRIVYIAYLGKKFQIRTLKVQGSGKEYLGNDGKWYHESELIEFNKNGTPNPSYNKHGAKSNAYSSGLGGNNEFR